MAPKKMAPSSDNSVSGEEIDRVLGSTHDFVEAVHAGCDICTQLRDAWERVRAEASSEAILDFQHVLEGFSKAKEEFRRARSSGKWYPNHYSAFHWAAEEGHIDIVQFLHGVDPKPDGKAKGDALYLAVREGHLVIVQFLLGVDPKPDGKAMGDALKLAVREGHIVIVQFLLGVDPKPDGEAMGDALKLAVREGHIVIVQCLLGGDPKPDGNAKRDALKCAAREGQIDIVQFFLGVDPKPDGEDKGDALQCAARNGYPHVVQALLDVLDVDPKVGVDALVGVQSTAICEAADKGHVGVVEAVLKHPKVNVEELARVDSCTPLHGAARGGQTGVLEVLLKHPQFDVNKINFYENTPLHYAVEEGHIGVVEVLLKHPSVDVNAKDAEGATPVHVALREGENGILELLLKHPSLDVNATVRWAVKEGVEVLLKHPSLDANGTFRLAMKEGDNEVVEGLLKHSTTMDVNAKDDEGATPLHVAVKKVQNGVVELLLKHPLVDVNATYDEGATPFHVAVCLASLNVVYCAGVSSWQNKRLEDMYLEKLRKAHLNDWFEDTNERNYWKIVQLFAKHMDGHKLDQEDNYSKTALEYAYESKDVSIWQGLSQAEPVTNYIEGLYKDRQVYVDAANAILVGAALIASVTFGSWLQPPLSYTFEGDGYSSQSSPSMPKYVDVEHNVALRVFWVFNCFSFYFAMATVVIGACSVLPRRKLFIKKIVQKLRRYLIATSILLGCSVLCVIVAFGISGSIVLAPMLKFQSIMIVPTTIGGLICLISLGILFKNIVEDMELKDLQICLPRCFKKT